jgi:hypothetical protein
LETETFPVGRSYSVRGGTLGIGISEGTAGTPGGEGGNVVKCTTETIIITKAAAMPHFFLSIVKSFKTVSIRQQ